eukprot:TRINITY_DN2817_c0_g2_i2.p1 TRINITY_DN2817_c0_g2~~TRINITY_DN2817_c0_g2_i2.p1  ORF type:complete len:979 (+),score=246.14 TRINITY_DN2817_c0_g2_i2:558-3494(+)
MCYRYELDDENEPIIKTKSLLDDEECEINAMNDPIVQRECFVPLCPDYGWIVIGDFGECSAKCKAEGKMDPYMIKKLVCVDKNNCNSADCAEKNILKCAGTTKPASSEWQKTCNTDACIIPVQWKTNIDSIQCSVRRAHEVECGTTEKLLLELKCIISSTGKEVSKSKCASLEVQTFKECPAYCSQDFKFEYSDWTKCSSDSCDIGIQYRSKSCIKSVDNRRLRFLAETRVNIDECENAGLIASQLTKKCQGAGANVESCKKYEWEYEWENDCSVQCGGGIEIPSSTKCMETVEGVEATDISKCSDTPKTEKSCNRMKCPSFKWEVQDWGECSKPCGNDAVKTRKAYCANDNGIRVAKKKCASEDVLLEDVCTGIEGEVYNGEAFNVICSPKTIFNWFAGDYGNCVDTNGLKATCGGGLSTRDVKCHEIVIDGSGVITENIETVDSNCVAGDKPAVSKTCNTRPCEETYRWVISHKSECSVPCGGGRRKLSLKCVNSKNDGVLDSNCDLLPQPETSEVCNTNACNFCDETDCNAAGDSTGTQTCNRDLEKCVCNTDLWSGLYCQIDVTCGGTKLSDGTCCVGKADFNNICCDNASDILDKHGNCCSSGLLNGCAECLVYGTNENAQLIPGTSSCCESGLISSGLICCDIDSYIDECGVCGGLNDCLAKIITIEEKSITVDTCEMFIAAIMDPDSDTYKAETIAAADVFGVDLTKIQFDSATCKAIATATGARRLSESDVFQIGIESVVAPDGTSPSELADLIASNIATNAPSIEAETSIGGNCGDGVCHLDEQCLDNSENCCVMDCPVVDKCEAPAFSDEECGGPSHGVCDTGLCICNEGYMGDECEKCSSGFVIDETTYTCTKLTIGYVAVETCNDNILNNGETSTDCGGGNCPACVIVDNGSSSSDENNTVNIIFLVASVVLVSSLLIIIIISTWVVINKRKINNNVSHMHNDPSYNECNPVYGKFNIHKKDTGMV